MVNIMRGFWGLLAFVFNYLDPSKGEKRTFHLGQVNL